MTRRTALLLPLALRVAAAADDRAVILVTGMRVGPGPAGETRDLTVAEGASVTLTLKKSVGLRKQTSALALEGRRGGPWFTADFPVELGGVYDISMTFRDGTTIRIDDYRLPPNWKTHFLFHNTRGTKSPASILRKKTDAASGLSCYVYAVWPVAAYEKMTARQLAPQ